MFGRTSIGINLWSWLAPARPVITIENASQQTGSYIIGDSLDVTATIPGNSSYITAVDLYANGVLVGAMIVDTDGVWSLRDTSIPAGARTYVARSTTGGGGMFDSDSVTITALDVLDPSEVTSAGTLFSWYRTYNGESIQMSSTMDRVGGVINLTVTSASSLLHRTEQITVTCTLGGVRGTSKVNVRLNGVLIYTDQPTAATLAVTGTDLTLNFPVGTYTLNAVWRSLGDHLLDKVSGYTTNSFDQTTANKRPIIMNPGSLGAPCLQFAQNGFGNSVLICTGAFPASMFSGADKSFYVPVVLYVDSIASAGGAGIVWCASNITDTDQPRIELNVNPSTAPAYWRINRRSDTGVDHAASSHDQVYGSGGGYLVEYLFDGTTGVLTVGTNDEVGGENLDVPFPTGSATVTVTRASLGMRTGQTGELLPLKMQLYEIAFFEHPPTDPVERIQHQRYYTQ
jgi:hypothetical protein